MPVSVGADGQAGWLNVFGNSFFLFKHPYHTPKLANWTTPYPLKMFNIVNKKWQQGRPEYINLQ